MDRLGIPAVALWTGAAAVALVVPAATPAREAGGPIVWVLVGMLGALALYTGLVAIASGERSFATYAGYAAASLVLWVTYFDVTGDALADETARQRANHAATAALFGFALLFARSFLDTARRQRRLDDLLRSLAMGAFAGVPLGLVVPAPALETALAVYGAAVSMLVVAAAVTSLARGFLPAALLLLAVSPFAFAALLFSLTPMGLAREPLVDGTTFMAMHVLEMVMLSLALAGRIAALRLERDRARQESEHDRRLRAEQEARAGALEVKVAAALAHATLEAQRARTDPLTGLRNRADFERELEALEAGRAADHLRDALVAVVDLDGLKAVNDLEGHTRGDALLVAFADALRASLRAGDRCFRVGGDEFVVIARGATANDAAVLGRRLGTAAATLRRLGFPEADASVGVASLEEAGGDPRRAFTLADERMYDDKRSHVRARRTLDPPPSSVH